MFTAVLILINLIYFYCYGFESTGMPEHVCIISGLFLLISSYRLPADCFLISFVFQKILTFLFPPRVFYDISSLLSQHVAKSRLPAACPLSLLQQEHRV